MIEQEVWKDINNFEGYYQVSNIGRVKSLDRVESVYRGDVGLVIRPRKGRILKHKINKSGYPCVHLRGSEAEKHPSVHRLVAEAFVPNPENKPSVNHIDADKLNNSVSNLEWATNSEQMRHAVENNLLEILGRVKYSLEFKKEVLDYQKQHNLSLFALSKVFNISERTAGRIVKNLSMQWQFERIIKESEVEEIKTLRKQGQTYKEIGLKFGIGISQTKRICDNESRKGET